MTERRRKEGNSRERERGRAGKKRVVELREERG